MPDIEKYRGFVNHFDLTDEQKVELIHIGWMMAESFVDRAVGGDPVQLALHERDGKRALASSPMIEFTRAADGTFAISDVNTEREET